MATNEQFMICDLRFAISGTGGGRFERGAASLKSSIINHPS
jgi:hypothetical protein